MAVGGFGPGPEVGDDGRPRLHQYGRGIYSSTPQISMERRPTPREDEGNLHRSRH